MDKKVENIISKISEKFGDGSIRIASNIPSKKVIQTPWPTLNNLCGGFHSGRFSIVAGPSQVGKTALCLQTIAYQQDSNEDFLAVWVDFENAFDPSWAKQLGIDIDRLVVVNYTDKVNVMEKAMDLLLKVVEEMDVDMIVIDSIGAMLPKADVESKKGERSMEDSNMLNLQVKLGEFFRRMNISIANNDTAVVLLGHVYNVPSHTGASITEVRGGNSVKHWGHIRLAMRRAPKDKWPDPVEIVGPDGTKSKVSPGFSTKIVLEKSRANSNEGQSIVLPFYYGRGFDLLSSCIGAAMSLGIIERSGPMYKIMVNEEEIKFKGMQALKEGLDDKDLLDHIKLRIAEMSAC